MSRDMQKLIDEYREKFPESQSKGPCITVKDISDLIQISHRETYQLVDNSLLAGIMIGYKYALYEQRKKRKKA